MLTDKQIAEIAGKLTEARRPRTRRSVMPAIHWSHKEEKYWIRDGDDILWFDGPLEAEAGQRYLETKNSIDAEIALIANYFRKMGMTSATLEDFI